MYIRLKNSRLITYRIGIRAKSTVYGSILPIASITAVTLRVDPQTVINPAIVGGGVYFAFSDYVYTDLVTGESFSRQIPYSPDPAEEERLWEEYFRLADYTGMRYIRLQVSYTQWDPLGGEQSGGRLLPGRYRLARAGDCARQTELQHTQHRGFCRQLRGAYYHLIAEKGYTCVRGFSVFNEPEHFRYYTGGRAAAITLCGLPLGHPYAHWYVEKSRCDRITSAGRRLLTDGETVTLPPESITVLTTYTHGTETVFADI